MPYQVSSWQFSESFDEDLVAVLVEDLVVRQEWVGFGDVNMVVILWSD